MAQEVAKNSPAAKIIAEEERLYGQVQARVAMGEEDEGPRELQPPLGVPRPRADVALQHRSRFGRSFRFQESASGPEFGNDEARIESPRARVVGESRGELPVEAMELSAPQIKDGVAGLRSDLKGEGRDLVDGFVMGSGAPGANELGRQKNGKNAGAPPPE